MKTIGIIPARSGSKSLKNKNILPICGMPLIGWTIKEALNSNLDKVMVSTDSEEIANISRGLGIEVPFLRPAELATDTSHTSDAILHTLDQLNEKFDYVMTLQPTSPLRTSEHINRALNNIGESNSLISICKYDYCPWWLLKLNNDKIDVWIKDEKYPDPFNIERQQFETMYRPNGAIYLTKTDYLIKTRQLVDYDDCRYILMDDISSMEIDNYIDYIRIKSYMEGVGYDNDNCRSRH